MVFMVIKNRKTMINYRYLIIFQPWLFFIRVLLLMFLLLLLCKTSSMYLCYISSMFQPKRVSITQPDTLESITCYFLCSCLRNTALWGSISTLCLIAICLLNKSHRRRLSVSKVNNSLVILASHKHGNSSRSEYQTKSSKMFWHHFKSFKW